MNFSGLFLTPELLFYTRNTYISMSISDEETKLPEPDNEEKEGYCGKKEIHLYFFYMQCVVFESACL